MISCAYAPPRTGKSVYGVGHALEYLHRGCRLVTNFPLNQDAIEKTRGRNIKKARVTFCSPRPTSAELYALGEGWHPDHPNNEDYAGLIIFDEAGTWIGSRTWDDKDRQEIIKWFTLSGKLGWDVLILVQNPDLLDKAIRNSCIELFGMVMRTDRVKLPLGIRLPRFHAVKFRYGTELNAPKAFSKLYRGSSCFPYFETHHMFKDAAPYSLWRPSVPMSPEQLRTAKLSTVRKHPLAEKIMRIPCPIKRAEFFRRFESCGAFDPPLVQLSRAFRRELVGLV